MDNKDELKNIIMQTKLNFILNHIKNTHTQQDIKDLYTFNKEEINEIYNIN